MSENKQVDVKESSMHALSLHALDFTKLIEEKQRAHFAGTREWLFDAVKVWLSSTTTADKRLFWVVGDAGTGKSVISAKLLQIEGIKEHIVAWHFCRHDNAAMSAVNVILMSWAAMLSEKLPGFEMSGVNNSGLAASAEELFEQLIGGPLSRMVPPSAPCVIVLDALDELPKEALFPVLSLIANVFDSLPKFMRLFVTSRNQNDIIKRLEKFGNEKLLVDEVRNKADLRAYLAHVAREHVDLEITTKALEQMLEKEFGLPEATLKDQLAELESLIAQSKYIYQEAVGEFKALPEYRAICKIRDIESNPTPIQSATTMDELYQDATLAHAKLVSAFAKGKEEGWVDIVVDPGLKTLESANRKVQNEYKGNPRLLKDLVRFTAEFLSCSRMDQFMERFRAQPKEFQFVALKNKHANPTALGYRDLNLTLLVNLEGGRSHLCELQVNLKTMLVAKEKAHLHYEKIRVRIPHICVAANIADKGRFETSLVKILNSSMIDSVVAALEIKAGGLFLYATLLAHQLQQDKDEQHAMKMDFNKLYALPNGLSEIYEENFDRLVGVDKTRWKLFVPVIALIVATREPLIQQLMEAVLSTSLDVQSSLSLLFPVRDGCFQVVHKSVVDWLRDDASTSMYTIRADNLKLAHATLGRFLLKCCAQGSGLATDSSALHSFAMRQVVYHLCQAGMTDEVYGVVGDLHWILLRAKMTPVELLADTKLAADSAGPHQLTCKLLHSALNSCFQVWREDYQRIPGQLVGRLLGFEADAEVGQFLKQVRSWCGPPQGWWCLVSQTLPSAGGAELSRFELPRGPRGTQWSPDGTSVAWAEQNLVNVTNVTNGSNLVLEGHTNMVESVAWSNDNKRVCSVSYDYTTRMWDVESGECIKILNTGVGFVSWSSDDKRLCSSGEDKKVCVWSVESGECIKTLRGHAGLVFSLSWSSDGKRVYGGGDKVVYVWDLESGECIKTLAGHSSFVYSVSCSHVDNKRVCSGDDTTVRVWDVESGECIKTLQDGTNVNSVGWSNDGKRVCSGSDRAVRVWDVESGKCVKVFKANVQSMRWSSDDKRIHTTSLDKTVRVWDVENGGGIEIQNHAQMVSSVSWSSDGKRLCSGGRDKTVCVWDVENGKCIKTLRTAGGVNSVSCSSDGNRICSGDNGAVRIWDVESGECVKILKGHTNSVSWSSDSKRVCSGGIDKTVRVWDVESGECVKTLKGHTNDVHSVSWSSDGKRVCSGSKDEAVRVWDLESGECIKTYTGHVSGVYLVSWSSDSKKICSSSYDQIVRVWDLESDLFFCTRLLDIRLQPTMIGAVEFASNLEFRVHPLLSRAVAIQDGSTLHCLQRLGVSSLPTYSDEQVFTNECQTCGGREERTCADCLHRAWCLVNLVHLPLGMQEEERSRQKIVSKQSNETRSRSSKKLMALI